MNNKIELILLSIPLVLPSLGFFYLNQRLTNTSIGLYIRDILQKRIQSLTNDNVFLWESYVRENTTFTREALLFAFILIIFLKPKSGIKEF